MSRHTPQALHKAAQALESKERRVLAQCMLNDRRAKDTTLSNDDRLAGINTFFVCILSLI